MIEGVSYSAKRYSKANIKYFKSHDGDKPSKLIWMGHDSQ